MNNCKINIGKRFSPRFCDVMEYYNIKTVGKVKLLLKFFNSPHAKVWYSRAKAKYVRVSKLKSELESFERNYKTK
jgi:hypothetical protein